MKVYLIKYIANLKLHQFSTFLVIFGFHSKETMPARWSKISQASFYCTDVNRTPLKAFCINGKIIVGRCKVCAKRRVRQNVRPRFSNWLYNIRQSVVIMENYFYVLNRKVRAFFEQSLASINGLTQKLITQNALRIPQNEKHFHGYLLWLLDPVTILLLRKGLLPLTIVCKKDLFFVAFKQHF